MPPLKGIDRGLNGDALKALEETGHGRRLAIVDASYNIPRWAQIVDYSGSTTLQALIGIMHLVPWEGKLIFMKADEGDTEHAGEFSDTAYDETGNEFDYPDAIAVQRQDTVVDGEVNSGFYSIANDESVDTLFVRTRDTMPYACATFIVGHSQG